MLSPKLQGALNDQINAELGSAYLYLAMAAHLEASNLQGSAQWMRRQAREEVSHAMKIFDFVNDCDGRVVLKAIPEPQAEFSSTVEIWESTLKQERGVSASIHALYALASQEKDYATQTMLQWFVTEQVEEEKTAKTILEQVKRIGPSNSAIYFLDRHLGKDAEAKK
ncbi:MAG: ferritin [Gemmatimonadaceae bacterium]|nr:ferritin [Gemmatimonadaceae bacterium]